MVNKSLKNINTKLKFPYRKNELLNEILSMWLYNFLIQQRFDYDAKVTQSKYIGFCLKLKS